MKTTDKKRYISPSCKVVALQHTTGILAGSSDMNVYYDYETYEQY